MWQQKLPYIGRIVSLIVLMSVIGALVVSFVKNSGKLIDPPPPARSQGPGRNVTAIIEGYEYVSRENGKNKIKLTADRDITYDDGHHELENLSLVSFSNEGKEEARIRADHGSYDQQQGQASFTGHVVASNADGLEVRSETLNYNQHTGVGNTDVAVSFSYRALSGTSIGGVVYTRENLISLLKDAVLIVTQAKQPAAQPPIEIRAQKAEFARNDGIARFTGQASIRQGNQSGQADSLTGIFSKPEAAGTPAHNPRLLRVEARGNSLLKSLEQGRASELQAQDMDFQFDDEQRLKLAEARNSARARSLEKDAPREMSAEKIIAQYLPGARGSELSVLTTQGRTVMKIAPPEGETSNPKAAERVLEADAVQMNFHPEGKYLARAEASGNARLTVTPVLITPQAERQRLQAPKFTAEFFPTGNLLKNFVAEEGAKAEFEPLQEQSADGRKREKKIVTGKKLTADFDQQTQEISTLALAGNAKFVAGERQATAANALYTAANKTVALRGKPQVWDNVLRVNADEIDTSTETSESTARGRVQTTYYSRETTNGAAPFKKTKAPIFIASDRGLVKHEEGLARYEGNARAWQDDNFVRAGTIELNRQEKTMTAVGNVNSALYAVERTVEETTAKSPPKAAALQPATEQKSARKEIVPIFATSEQMSYADSTRTVKYSGRVKIKQGSDQIEGESAEAILSEENKLTRLTASRNVVLTQPFRRGTGDQVDYDAVTETAILTGNSARVEDREQEAVTTGAKLTLYLRDARIQAADEGGSRRVKTTHRIRQQ